MRFGLGAQIVHLCPRESVRMSSLGTMPSFESLGGARAHSSTIPLSIPEAKTAKGRFTPSPAETRIWRTRWIEPLFVSGFVLGQVDAMLASPKDLQFLSESIPPDSLWAVVGHGGHGLKMSFLAMLTGGHARAGFEDNPLLPSRPGGNQQRPVDRAGRTHRARDRPGAHPLQRRRRRWGLRPASLCLRSQV